MPDEEDNLQQEQHDDQPDAGGGQVVPLPTAAVMFNNETVRDRPIEEELVDSYLIYAMMLVMTTQLPQSPRRALIFHLQR